MQETIYKTAILILKKAIFDFLLPHTYPIQRKIPANSLQKAKGLKQKNIQKPHVESRLMCNPKNKCILHMVNMINEFIET